MATRIPSETRPGSRRPREVCLPACPACGGLECLCRPRFFAGQLLTEQDLNRLDRYIRDKNRLHNRYLHGWGVVCGLEVTCHECEGYVRVGAGYGLSPCGDDIIVCEDDAVPVCDLIRRCSREERRRECDPPRRRDPSCEEGDETWVLAICYDEKPSRGVTALRSAGCTCGRCSGATGGCGSGRHCGCGCNGNSHDGNGHNGNGKTRGSVRPAPAQCEPTVICEGYRYEVYRAPLGDREAESSGVLVGRFQECVRPYFEFAEQLGQNAQLSEQPSRAEQHRLCCMMKERLREILLDRPIHNCQLLTRLDAAICPSPTERMSDPEWNEAIRRATETMILVWVEGVLGCLCSVLLPPCPAPVDDNCIPLATVTVRRRDCRILRVCNWTVHRKLATTFPSLQYWLSILPFGRLLRQQIERFCCRLADLFRPREPQEPDQPTPVPGQPVDQPFGRGIDDASPGFVFGAFFAGEQPGTAGRATTEPIVGIPSLSAMRSRDFSNLLLDAVLDRATTLTPQTLFRGVMATRSQRVESPLKEIERENVPQYLLANTILAPLVRGMVPEEFTGAEAAFDFLRAEEAGAEREPRADVDSLRREMADLRTTVARQQEIIDRLSRRLGDEE